MSETLDLKKYIVFCEERSTGPQCNIDHVWVVELSAEPTIEWAIKDHLIYPGSCTNISYPGCESCGGSYVSSFRFEIYTPERAKELGLGES